jgi:hypothetical protein
MGLDMRRSSVFGMACAAARRWDALEEGLDPLLRFPEADPAALKNARNIARTSAGATVNVFDEHGEWLTVEDSSEFTR